MRHTKILGLAGATALAAAMSACSAGGGGTFTGGGGAGAGQGSGSTSHSSGDGGGFLTSTTTGTFTNPTGGGDAVVTPQCTQGCTDFPKAPIKDGTIPANVDTMFGAPGMFTGSLCIVEPQLSAGNVPGALFPANWVRVRFRVKPANGENLFEIRISAKSQVNELIAYTDKPIWTMPADVWKGLGVNGNAVDQPITVTIRGLNTASPAKVSGATGTFTIAPVTAGGSMVYWATTSSDVMPGTSKLIGFYVGNETVGDALTIPEIAQTGIIAEGGSDLRGMYGDAKGVPPGHVECIGCHVSTPDGKAVGYTDHWPWNNVITSVDAMSVGAIPTYLTAGEQRLLNQPWMGMMTFSRGHWASGDMMAVTSYSTRDGNVGFAGGGAKGNDKLAWFQLDAQVTIPWTQGQSGPLNMAITARSEEHTSELQSR